MARPVALTLLAASLALSACGGARYRTFTIPPQLSLSQYERVGLAMFTVENAKGSLHEFATQKFAEAVLAASRGVEVLELGSADSVRRRVGETTFGAATAQAIGTTRNVPAVFVGHLKVQNPKASGGFVGFDLPHLEATITLELTVGLYSAKTGGTVWRSSAIATEKVGQVSLSGGVPSFSAKDPNAAYGRLVNRLINAVSYDLWPTYERRRVN